MRAKTPQELHRLAALQQRPANTFCIEFEGWNLDVTGCYTPKRLDEAEAFDADCIFLADSMIDAYGLFDDKVREIELAVIAKINADNEHAQLEAA